MVGRVGGSRSRRASALGHVILFEKSKMPKATSALDLTSLIGNLGIGKNLRMRWALGGANWRLKSGWHSRIADRGMKIPSAWCL